MKMAIFHLSGLEVAVNPLHVLRLYGNDGKYASVIFSPSDSDWLDVDESFTVAVQIMNAALSGEAR